MAVNAKIAIIHIITRQTFFQRKILIADQLLLHTAEMCCMRPSFVIMGLDSSIFYFRLV